MTNPESPPQPEVDPVAERLSNLQPFIAYLEATTDDEWYVDKVRNADNTQNCVMGHLINWVHGKDYTGNISPVWDCFEEMWATTFMIYPVNDGESPSWMNHRYDQATPRERVIAYLRNLAAGDELTTMQVMEQYEREDVS